MDFKFKLLLSFVTLTLATYSQEICNDGIDNDSDGLVDINDPDCQCSGGLSTVSLISNPSYENLVNSSNCPNSPGQMNKAVDWIQMSDGTIDYYSGVGSCNYTSRGSTYAGPPSPPDGSAFVGAIYNSRAYFTASAINYLSTTYHPSHGYNVNDEAPKDPSSNPFGIFVPYEWHEYTGQCLPTALAGNTTYSIKFDMAAAAGDVTSTFAFGTVGSGVSNPTVNVGIYGRAPCGGTFSGGGTSPFPPLPPSSWQLLSTVNVTGLGTSWQNFTWTFTTPASGIAQIMLGPIDDGAPNTGIHAQPAEFPPGSGAMYNVRSNYYYLDNLVLTSTVVVPSPTSTIIASGTYCGGNLIYSHNTTSSSSSITSYQWYKDGIAIGAATSSTLNVSSMTNGVYELRINYADGSCSICNNGITLTVPAGPVANAGSNQIVTCSSPSVTLSGSGGVSYNWSPSAGISNPNIAGPTASPSNSTTYTLTVTDGNGCTDTDAVTITANNSAPTASAGSNQIINCTNTSALLNGSGGVSYNWSPSIGLSNSNIASPTATPSSTTTYTLTATGSNGCTDTDVTIVTVNTVTPTANAGNDVSIDCITTTTTLSGNGGVSYSWSPSVGLSNTNIANPTASPSGTTTYTLTATGSNGCTDTDAVTVTVNGNLPTANAGSDVTTDCTTPTTTLSGSGGGSYSWSPSSGLSNANIASPVADPASTTIYTLTVTATNGCTATDAMTVTVDETISANAGSDLALTCASPSGTINSIGTGGTVSWTPTTGLSDPTILTPIVTPISSPSSTTYTLTVTGSGNGCVATDDVTVSITGNIPTITGSPDATIDCNILTAGLTASGADTYSWSPSVGLSTITGTTSIATPSVTTLYTVTGTNSAGCSGSTQILVTVDSIFPTVDAGTNYTITCTTPLLSLEGTSTGDFQWSGPGIQGVDNVATITVDETGYYYLTSTGINGCTSLDSCLVTVDTLYPTITDLIQLNF